MTEPSSTRALFGELLDLDPAARAARLEALANSAPEQAAELAELLALDQRSAPSLDAAFGPRELAEFLDPAHATDDLCGRELGPFRLMSLLGSGGMGAVYLARQKNPDRPVAVKVLPLALSSPESRARFEAEIRTLSGLNHPHIARLYQAGVGRIGSERDGLSLPYFAMEHVEDAGHLIERSAELPLEARLRRFLDVVDAIEFAHLKGVLHRDLKPQNLLVDGSGRAVVIDFGIARAIDATEGQTLSGQVLGSLSTMAPEQLEGDPELLDARADVYALGGVLYELCCGQPALDGADSSPFEQARKIREVDPPPPSKYAAGLPPELDWICARALAKEPDLRYASARDLGQDVRRLLDGRAVEAAPPSARYRLAKLVRRNRLASTLAALAALSLLGGAVAAGTGLVRAVRAEGRALTSLAQAEQETENLASLNDFLERVLTAASPFGEGREVRVVDLLDLAASELDGLSEQPTLERRQRNAISLAYGALGEYENSRAQALRAAELSRSDTLPSSLRELARALDAIATAEIELEQPAAALEVARELQALVEAELPALNAWRAEACVALARAALTDRDPQSALDLLQQSEQILREREGTRDLAPGLWENLMAQALTALDRHDEARIHALAGLERRQRMLADDDPRILTAVNDLLTVEVRSGEPGDGLVLARQQMPQWREAYGPTHPKLLHVSTNLGEALFLSGDVAGAAALLSESAANAVEQPRVRARLLNNLAGVHIRSGNLDAAEVALVAAVDVAESVPELLIAQLPMVLLNLYGFSAQHGDDPRRTVQLAQRIIELESAREEPRGGLLRGLRRTIPRELMRLDEPAEAEGYWAGLLEERAYADNAEIEAQLVGHLADCWVQLERSDEAQALLELWIPRLEPQAPDSAVAELRTRLLELAD